MNNYYLVLSMTRVNDTELRNIAKIMCSLYDGNLLSLNARNMNLPSCFSITGSVEHIISVNTIESGPVSAYTAADAVCFRTPNHVFINFK